MFNIQGIGSKYMNMNNVLAPQVRPQVLTVLWLAERLWGWLLFCSIFGLDQCYVVSLKHEKLSASQRKLQTG